MNTLIHVIKSAILLTIGVPVLVAVMLLLVFWDQTETRSWDSLATEPGHPQPEQGKVERAKLRGFRNAYFHRVKAREQTQTGQSNSNNMGAATR